MHEGEYDTLNRVENLHWWYVSFRNLVARCLRHPRFAPGAKPYVLDAGCGTGANLRFLNDLLKPAGIAGFDVSRRAIELARAKCPAADLYVSDIRTPELRHASYDLMLCCDVIYVPGIDACLAGLRAMLDRLSPGGLFVLNVPAYQWLYSEHDQAVHTRERYVQHQMHELLRSLDVKCELLSYRLCPLLPAIVAARLPSIVGRRKIAAPRSDLATPPKILNSFLVQLLECENRLLLRGARMPFGSSIFAIGRK